jgi:hypothetical protein
MNHLVNHITHSGLRSDNTLHVVAVVSNTERYHSRYRLAHDFIGRMSSTPHVRLHVVETAFGDRHHEVADHAEGAGGSVLRLRTSTHAWIKENMINLGVRHLLPADWRYVAWVDADVEFRAEHWAQETLHQLQHFHLLQPFSHVVDLGYRGGVAQTHPSFGHVSQTGGRLQANPNEPYQYGHSGYAWACTRVFWEQVHGLIDIGILGSGDHHMAWGAVGRADKTHQKLHANYRRRVKEWQDRAVRLTHGEVGCVEGRIEHSFHGPKRRRYYRERWQILVDHGFDPDVDLMRDAQGLLYLAGKPALEQAIRKYNRSRHEDSIEDT